LKSTPRRSASPTSMSERDGNGGFGRQVSIDHPHPDSTQEVLDRP